MCGRYYVDDETAGEIEKLVRELDEKRKGSRSDRAGDRQQRAAVGDPSGDTGHIRDIYPSGPADILCGMNGGIACRQQQWGLPGFGRNKVIFNARAEGVLEKRMFRDGILYHRCAVPAAGFYEWDRTKSKVVFFRKEEPLLYLAGFYDSRGDAERFVILTTAANTQMEPIHDRMPLLLDRCEIEDWVMDAEKMDGFLHKVTPALDIKREYHQESLFLE